MILDEIGYNLTIFFAEHETEICSHVFYFGDDACKLLDESETKIMITHNTSWYNCALLETVAIANECFTHLFLRLSPSSGNLLTSSRNGGNTYEHNAQAIMMTHMMLVKGCYAQLFLIKRHAEKITCILQNFRIIRFSRHN